MLHYQRTATTVAGKIPKGPTGKQIAVHKLTMTTTAAGTVLLTDGTNSYTVDVAPGVNHAFEQPLTFLPDCDVTITPTGGTVSVFGEFTYK